MSLSVQAIWILAFLAPGFLAFRTYMIDADWRSIRQTDVVYGSLIFSALGYACYLLVSLKFDNLRLLSFIGISFASSIVIAIVWRRFGHPYFHAILKWLQITNEDNRGDVWQKIFNDPGIYVTQITAYLKNGEAVQCDDTASFDTPELRKKGIFPYYTHNDRQICFVLTRRKSSAQAAWKDIDDIQSSERWGIRLVYINPDELQRLEIRVTPVAN